MYDDAGCSVQSEMQTYYILRRIILLSKNHIQGFNSHVCCPCNSLSFNGLTRFQVVLELVRQYESFPLLKLVKLFDPPTSTIRQPCCASDTIESKQTSTISLYAHDINLNLVAATSA